MNILKTISIIILSIYMQISAFSPKEKEEAFVELTLGNLEKLDALVGDTACQIRAHKIAILYDALCAAKKSGLSLTVDMLDPNNQEFLVLSRLLTKSKDLEVNPDGIVLREESNYKLLGLSKSKGTELIKKAQSKLSALSVEFLQQEAASLGDPELIRALSYTVFDLPAFKRKQVACMPGLKVILLRSIKLNRSLLVKITRFCTGCLNGVHKLKFLYIPQNGTFVFADISSIDSLDQAALVIEGFSLANLYVELTKKPTTKLACPETAEFVKTFASLDIMSILLSCAALHGQFTGTYKDKEIPYDELNIPGIKKEMADLREYGKTNGCCLENQKLFVIDHIYSNLLSLELAGPSVSVLDSTPSAAAKEKDEFKKPASKEKEAYCQNCGKPSSMRCSKCRAVYYCSPECQKSDFKKHKKTCCKT